MCQNGTRSTLPSEQGRKYANQGQLVHESLRRKEQMKKLIVILGLLVVFALPAVAQETPRFEVSAGYTFQDWQVPALFVPPPDYYHYNGFNAGGAYHFTQLVSLALDVTGTYNTTGGVGTHIYSYLAGPRIYPLGHHRLTPYFHGLVGGASFSGLGGQGVPDQTKLAWEAGAGLEYSLFKSVAIRVGQFDYEQTRFFHGEDLQADPVLPKSNQNNYKFSAALVLRFGGK